MAAPPEIILRGSGMRAVLEPDRWNPGSVQLVVDGTPQSHVDPADPTHLFFEYVQRMGHVLDRFRPPGEPITVVHLGAGALTLPRYVEATRPGSRQQVIELERDLVEFVREHLPLPAGASIRIRYGDAREVVSHLPSGLDHGVDAIIVDVFGGSRIPAHVTSLEFYASLLRLLRPDGIVLVNVADGPGLSFARGQAATVQLAFGHVAVLAESGVVRGRRYGNLVLLGSPAALPLDMLPRLLAQGPHPAVLVAGADVRDWIGAAPVVTDATATPSPPPARGIFGVRSTGD